MINPKAKKQNILLAEDDKYMMILYTAILEKDGYKVTKAKNGKEALALMKRQEFDLILLDILMPVMDGLELLKEIKGSPLGKKFLPKTVVLTNITQDLTTKKAIDYGVRDYMVKSDYDPEQFLEKVCTYLC